MAYHPKKLAIYAATGLLIAASIILAMQFVPMPFTPSAKTGVLVLKITDAPPSMKPKSLNITIDSIMVHKEGDEAWITFDLNGNQTFDLVKLENVTDLIGANVLPVGNYTMIQMHISSVIADLNEEKGVKLTVPSDYIKIPIRFTIKEDETTVVLLDITYDSVKVSAHHHLSPVVHPTVEKQP